jgi:TrmH family RNA methyltransferase
MADQALINRFRAARKDPTLVVLEGFHAIKHALRFGAEIELCIMRDASEVQRLAAALAPDVRQQLKSAVVVSLQIFQQLAPTPHPTGVIALARRPRVMVKELLKRLEPAPIVVLFQPQRLSNIGASVRVAAAAGATGLIVIGDADPWSPEAVRGGAGLQFALPVTQAPELPPTTRPIIAIDPEGDEPATVIIPPQALLLFGSERDGIEPTLLTRANQRLRIPMQPGVSSLNLATSVAAVLYAYGSGNTLQ